MEEKRAKALEALSTFIESQQALLTRTETDIARLRRLRGEIAATPNGVCSIEAFGDKLRVPGELPLSEQPDVVPGIPKDVDWSLFATSDPTPFRTLATASRSVYAQQHRPPTKQMSSPTPLQQLVRNRRVIMVDSILSTLPPLSSDEEDEPLDPEELRRLHEREKIRELKRRKVHGGSARSYGLSGLGLRKTDADAVFVRNDQVDESGEVDIGAADGTRNGATRVVVPATPSQTMMEVDGPAPSVPAYATKAWPPPDPAASTSHTGRTRRPTQKATHNRKATTSGSKKKAFPPSPSEEPEDIPQPDSQTVDKKGKPRPDTYKQAWSVSEQHLLERLLEEIPDGEKNRWLKISQAMNGRRTARQVASRVQKYYEKLKRFGLDVGNNASSRGNST